MYLGSSQTTQSPEWIWAKFVSAKPNISQNFVLKLYVSLGFIGLCVSYHSAVLVLWLLTKTIYISIYLYVCIYIYISHQVLPPENIADNSPVVSLKNIQWCHAYTCSNAMFPDLAALLLVTPPTLSPQPLDMTYQKYKKKSHTIWTSRHVRHTR